MLSWSRRAGPAFFGTKKLRPAAPPCAIFAGWARYSRRHLFLTSSVQDRPTLASGQTGRFWFFLDHENNPSFTTFRSSGFPTVGLLPRPILPLLHHPSQDAVDSRLVAGTFRPEPVHDFTIYSQSNPLLSRTAPARLRPLLLFCQRKQVILNRGKQPVDSSRPGSRFSLSFLRFTCHDTIVQPIPS
jgi:hypothetical protein